MGTHNLLQGGRNHAFIIVRLAGQTSGQRPARQRCKRTFTAEFWVSGHQYDHQKAPKKREGHAVDAKQPISLDVRRQEKTVMPTPHTPGCRVRVV